MTRCYLPVDRRGLQQAIQAHEIAMSKGHGVTGWLRSAWPEASEEDLEYAALMAAAADSAQLNSQTTNGQRVVLVVEATVLEESGDSTAIRLKPSVPWSDLLAIQADPDPIPLAEEADFELGWFANQEAAALLDRMSAVSSP